MVCITSDMFDIEARFALGYEGKSDIVRNGSPGKTDKK